MIKIFCLFLNFFLSIPFVIFSDCTAQTFSTYNTSKYGFFDSQWNPVSSSNIITECAPLNLMGGKSSSGSYLYGKNAIGIITINDLQANISAYQMILKFTIYVFGSTDTTGLIFKVLANYTNNNNLQKTQTNYVVWGSTSANASLYCQTSMGVYNVEVPFLLTDGLISNGKSSLSLIAPQVDSKFFGIRNIEITYRFCQSYCVSCVKYSGCSSCLSPAKMGPSSSYLCTCGSGYFWTSCNTENVEFCQKSCKACTDKFAHCLTCSEQACTSCEASYFLYSQYQGGSSWSSVCTNSCPAGSVFVSPDQCKCDSPCASCAGSTTNCLTCIDQMFLMNGSCVNDCTARYYKEGGVCKGCDSSCSTCKGSTSSDCLSCDYSKFVYFEGTCNRTECPLKYFNDNGKCSSCDGSCATCSGANSNECTSCDLTRFVLHLGECKYAECPVNYVNVSGKCLPCDVSCEKCKGTNNNECVSCKDKTFVVLNGMCFTDKCPVNYYLENGECKSCDSSCASCDGGYDKNCTSCDISKYVLLNGSCIVGPCPLNYYENSGKCYVCDNNCETCNGSLNNK